MPNKPKLMSDTDPVEEALKTLEPPNSDWVPPALRAAEEEAERSAPPTEKLPPHSTITPASTMKPIPIVEDAYSSPVAVVDTTESDAFRDQQEVALHQVRAKKAKLDHEIRVLEARRADLTSVEIAIVKALGEVK